MALTAAHSTLAASSGQLQPPLPNTLVMSGKQASLQQSSLASQASASLTVPSARLSGSATTPTKADGLMHQQLPSASAKAGQLTGSGSAVSPRQKGDPSPAELALAKQKSLAAGAAGPVTEDAQAFVLSPRHKRDPSPAELGLIRHQSSTSKVLHNRHFMCCSGTLLILLHASTFGCRNSMPGALNNNSARASTTVFHGTMSQFLQLRPSSSTVHAALV